ncbi:hypothetical protein COLO4_21551 [Corchorus olitorius]|uniref:Uncharacterized protein n=1 Tax=Corchorus olitorius TaxID=93759 RepID=A0A1R3ISL4_9ROSI|nr:hypothetical protein COLO4_21551 [Corchorus olitorius]
MAWNDLFFGENLIKPVDPKKGSIVKHLKT